MSVWRKKNFGLMQSAIARKIVAPLFLTTCGAFVARGVLYWFLSRTRLIVERLGGRVSCESDEGKGATFEFTLPSGEVKQWQ